MSTTKKKSSFADLEARYKRYDPSTEGYGDPNEWKDAFRERMGIDEAREVLKGYGGTPRGILGVSISAGWEEIKKAFRRLVLENHPDRVKGDKTAATETLKKINAAYSVLAHEFGR